MRAALPVACLVLAALCMGGCAGKRWTGPGEYLVKGPGPTILDGPFPDPSSCNAKLPPLPRSQPVTVCVFLQTSLGRGL